MEYEVKFKNGKREIVKASHHRELIDKLDDIKRGYDIEHVTLVRYPINPFGYVEEG
jgi:hypothetical protein